MSETHDAMRQPENGRETQKVDDAKPGPGLTIGTRAAIPLGYAVVVAVFVALGLQGELFARLMRNDPGAVAISFTLAIVAVVIPLVALVVARGSRNAAGRWIRTAADVLGASLLVAAAIVAVVIGVDSYTQREQPILSASAVSRTAARVVTIRASSSALSLRTVDRMLLRIVAFPRGVGANAAQVICRNSSDPEPAADGVKLLYWGESGPTVTGSAVESASVMVDAAEYSYVCALAVLTSHVQSGPKDTRLSSMMIDLNETPQE